MIKKFFCSICFIFMLLMLPRPVQAQTYYVEQLILDISKLSYLKSILSDMKTGYTVISGGYDAVKSIAQGNFDLHKAFLDGLLIVSPGVKNYQKISMIISDQLEIVSEYKSANAQFSADPNFSANELTYLSSVYSNLINQSVNNLNTLLMIITASNLRMSDDERMRQIDKVYEDMHGQLTYLRYFNTNTQTLGVQRAIDNNDVTTLRSIYGITN